MHNSFQEKCGSESIIKRWRLIFQGIYIFITLAAILITLFSILAVQCGFRRVPNCSQMESLSEKRSELHGVRGTRRPTVKL
jgi:hypothetical protein